MKEIVAVQNVTKQFQQKKAVNQINFSIRQGEVVAILGPNGAGKTTTLSMLLGLLKPSEGEIKLFGSDPKEKKVRERIGAMLQEVSVIPGLKVIEILELIRSYYPAPLPLQELVELTGLTEADLKTKAERLSGGQKRRLSFALAIAGNPELILLDEPTVGMDITSRNRFWQTIHAMADKGKTIIFSTHYLQEADEAAQRILLFKDGAIAADGSPGQIKSNRFTPSISFMVDAEISLEMLYQHPEIDQVHRKNNRVYLHSANTDRLLEIIFEEKLGARDIQIERGKLEDAFEQLIGEDKEAM